MTNDKVTDTAELQPTWHCWHCKWRGDHDGAVAHHTNEPTHKVTRTHDTWHGHGPTDTAASERDRLLAALWRIRMAAERATVDEPPDALPNRIIHSAEAAMGSNKQRAQRLAAGKEPDA